MYHLHFHACSAIIFYSRCYHWSYAMHALYCTVQFSIVYYYVMWCDVVVRHKVNLSCNLIPCTILDFSSGFSLLGFVYLVVRLLACSLSINLAIHFAIYAFMANQYYLNRMGIIILCTHTWFDEYFSTCRLTRLCVCAHKIRNFQSTIKFEPFSIVEKR